METTVVSARGQVVIPKLMRDAWQWLPGTALEVQNLPQGILLKPARFFETTALDDVMGCVAYNGPADLESAISQAGGVPPPPRAPITPLNPNAQPSATSRIRPRSVYKVDPYEDMRHFGY